MKPIVYHGHPGVIYRRLRAIAAVYGVTLTTDRLKKADHLVVGDLIGVSEPIVALKRKSGSWLVVRSGSGHASSATIALASVLRGMLILSDASDKKAKKT